MAKNWYPVINEEACIECGACTDRCKKGVYAATTMPPQVIQPDSCSFRCECCGDLCPVDALITQNPHYLILQKAHVADINKGDSS